MNRHCSIVLVCVSLKVGPLKAKMQNEKKKYQILNCVDASLELE